MQQKFSAKWKQFSGAQGDIVLSPSEFKEQWLYGIPLCNRVTGQSLPDSTIINKMLSAQDKIENEFGIKLFKQFMLESKDFIREEFMNWGFIKTSWPILKPCSLQGRLNEWNVINYPQDWLTIRRTNSNVNDTFKELSIIPNGQSSAEFSYLLLNYPSYFNFYGARILPNYWNIGYVTGFERIPNQILDIIGLITAIYILPLIEMSVGAVTSSNFGSASSSLSLDGLSQSISKMNGGNIFQNRIKDYSERLKAEMQALKSTYGGIKFEAM